MNALEWYRNYLFFQTMEPPGYTSDVGHASELREMLQKEGSLLVQPNNPILGQAFVSGKLDAGTVHRALKRHPLTYMEPDKDALCREICGMDTMFSAYVEKFIAKTGWTLSPGRANSRWLLEVLEKPGLIVRHPDWLEKVIAMHPWGWEVAMPEQFFTMHESPCRECLYDPVQKPWEHPNIVGRMLRWLHHRSEQSPRKVALAEKAWPGWMEHLRVGMDVHMQVMGPPDSSWGPSSIFTEKYFESMTTTLLRTWQQPMGDTMEIGGLLEDHTQML